MAGYDILAMRSCNNLYGLCDVFVKCIVNNFSKIGLIVF